MNESGWNQGRLMEAAGAYWGSCALHAAVELDIFTLLERGKSTAREIAEVLGADERGVATLLDAMAAMKLVMKTGERYAGTPAARRLLSHDSPENILPIIAHMRHIMPSWARLSRAVMTGKPAEAPAIYREGEEQRNFLLGMHNVAMAIAPRLVREIDLSNRKRLLDLGGGPGTYSIQFCLKNPALEAVIFDLADTRPIAESTVSAFGLSDRVTFVGGDYLEDDLGGSYDVAWLSQILHQEGPAGCRTIIERTVASLEPGGIIMIHEFLLDDTMDGPPFAALFSLNMLAQIEGGRAYSVGEISGMLDHSGVRDIRLLPFRGPNDSRIISGVYGGNTIE